MDMKPQLNGKLQYHKHINENYSHQWNQKMIIKSQNRTWRWITRMRNPENTTKNIKQIMKTYKWSRDLEELPDKKNKSWIPWQKDRSQKHNIMAYHSEVSKKIYQISEEYLTLEILVIVCLELMECKIL